MNNFTTRKLYKANLRKRILATIIDYSFIFLFTYVYIEYFGEFEKDGGRSVEGLMTLPVILVWLVYFDLIECAYSATFGHQLLNLKVLKVNGKNISFSDSLKRHLLDPIDILLYGIPAIVAILNSEKKQRLGDMWAKAIVIDMADPEQFSEDDK